MNDNHLLAGPSSFPSIYYAIRVKGLLDPHWDWLKNMTVTHLDVGETILCGPVSDQPALHGLLARIRDLNLTLIAVNRINTQDDKRTNKMNRRKPDIPQEIAQQLCADIRRQYQGKWWTLTGMQCMGCNTATKGDMTKRCVSNAPGFRGCNLVNARYDRQIKVGS